MPKRSVRLSEEASGEYLTIIRDSNRYFGKDISANYRQKIRASLRRIADNPEIGIAREELATGLRRYTVGSHFIYYQYEPDEIHVIHIYHQRQSEELGDWDTQV